MNILEKADKVTSGSRMDEYGHPTVNHHRTAEFWSVYLGIEVTPEQVCMMNILQKISRSMQEITEDTLTDIAGYSRNIEMLGEEEHEEA